MRRRLDPLSEQAEQRRDVQQLLRLAFITAAEDRSRSMRGRSLTQEELRRLLARYPGDLPGGYRSATNERSGP